MSETIPQKPRGTSSLSSDIRAYVKKRDNIRLVQAASERKHMEFYILFGELENLLLTMDRNNATVQKALVKLYELKTTIMPALDKK